MSDVTVKKLEQIEVYEGPHTIPGIKLHRAARSLGVTAWGMNVLELDANCTGYPEHDHVADGQEELYTLLSGSATLKAGGEEWKLEPGTLVRVGPKAKRKFIAGPKGATLLAIGATPGKAYEARKT
jgi:mannose-6-phosphate isomerase-like protein (cupin superfamily)